MSEGATIDNNSSRKKFSRRKSFELYKHVIELRKQEFSYTEIRKETGLAKSTINNWLTYAGLTLSKEHLDIQAKNSIKNHVLGIEASKVTRAKRKSLEIDKSIQTLRKFFKEPLFITGIMLYEAEGSKSNDCKFSNSDYRLILTFVRFIEKYFKFDKIINIKYSLYIHMARKNDLKRIKSFWAKKLSCSSSDFYIYWKRNIVTLKRNNPDYVGQVSVRVKGIPVLGSKLQAISDIILKPYYRE